MASDSAPFGEGNYDPLEALEAADKFSTADALDIEADDSEPPEEIWGGLRLAPGQLMEVIGGSGLGKSRMMLNLAVNQVLGRGFAGLPTCKRPLKWLFYGNENGFYRYRNDLRQMLKFCTADERERLRGHIFLPTMAKPMDAYVSFSDEQNRIKLKTTIRYRDADVVVLDPWGAVIDGDELDDGDVRKTIFEIMDILAANIEKPTAGIILNHSRNGTRTPRPSSRSCATSGTSDPRTSPNQSPKSSLYTQNRRISQLMNQGRWISTRTPSPTASTARSAMKRGSTIWNAPSAADRP